MSLRINSTTELISYRELIPRIRFRQKFGLRLLDWNVKMTCGFSSTFDIFFMPIT
jgi:hypothetical protein